jgi:hypothetical protein
MKLEEAFKTVMEEAESSAHRKSVVCGETLKAIETLRNFYKHYGHFFGEWIRPRQWDEEIIERLYIDDDSASEK